MSYKIQLDDINVSVNKIPFIATLELEVAPDDDFDLEPSLYSEIDRECVRSGDYEPSVLIVTAKAFGIEGTAVLGGVLLGRDENLGLTVKEYDLDAEAVNELEDKIKEQAALLARFTKGEK
jgi:hypothetical protein